MDIAKIVYEKIKPKSKIVFRNMPINDPKIRQPDLSAVKKIFNWEPKIQLDAGLDKTINYFRNRSKSI